MSRTGSTSEQKWLTSWRRRLRLAFLVSPLLVIATTASAGWWRQNAAPEAPQVSPAKATVRAGRGPLPLTVTNPSEPGQEFSWTALSPDAGVLVISGARKERADFPTPDTVCNALGETHLYRVRTVVDGGTSSSPTDVTVQVLPWGPPKAAFPAGTQFTLQAGQSAPGSVVLRPGAPTHECDRPGTDFPGVDTEWRLVDGGPLPPGVRLLTEDGGIVSGSSAVTPALRIEATGCTPSQFELTAQHFTSGGFGDEGPVSTLRVNVEPSWNPVSEATLQLAPLAATAHSAMGIASVGGLECLEQRGALGLQAHVSLSSGTSVVREGTFPVPGFWQFPLGESCLGTTYQLRGRLLVDGGVAEVEGGPVTVPALERPALRPMEAPHLAVRCQQPAAGVLEQRPLHPCSELPISWEQVDGPVLTQPAYTGQRIEVATQDTDFAELIGRPVVMRMSARTREEAVVEQAVPILAEPFVELRRHTEKATGADLELLGVSVTLRNTTECGVRQVEHLERLEGADYVPGSARFNGAPVEAGLEGDTLTVRGLVLEGGATGQLTYVVRPRLLERPHFQGQSFIRGVPVSEPVVEPAAGCGCSGGGSGLAALGLMGLVVALRRRRGR